MIDATIIPYIAFFCVAGIPALLDSSRRRRVAWSAVWLVFVVFIGLRHHVGADWFSYIRITQERFESSFAEAAQDPELLFSLLTWSSAKLGFGVYGANLVGAAIFCAGLFSYASKQANRWLALTTAVPFLIIAGTMSANKQGMAIGVVLFVMARWKGLSLAQRSVGILVAGLFHSSAMVLLVLVIVDLPIGRLRRTLLMLIAVVASIWVLNRPDAASNTFADRYIFEQTHSAAGAVMHLLLNLAPALAMLGTRKWWSRVLPNWHLIHSLCVAVVVMALLVPFYSQAVSRMSLYFFPVSISFFAWLPRMTGNIGGRNLVRLFSVAALATVLTIWIGYSNQAQKFRPYQNVLTTNVNELDMPR